MQTVKYEIAGIGIELKIPFRYTEERRFGAFRTEKDADVQIEFLLCGEPFRDKGEFIHGSEIGVFKKGHAICIEHKISTRIKPYAWLVWDERRPEQMNCYLLEEHLEEYRNIGHLFQLIRLEQIFMIQEAMVIHASFISWKDKAILFTAPSGTGKSTQAELWMRYQGAELINGDRAVLKQIKDEGEFKWQAFGLPYAGSSDVFRNESREIAVIVVLRQGFENEIRRLRPIEAFKHIYSELVIRSWDETYQEKLTESILKLVMQVPVYRLSCRPNEEAVDLLKKYLENSK